MRTERVLGGSSRRSRGRIGIDDDDVCVSDYVIETYLLKYIYNHSDNYLLVVAIYTSLRPRRHRSQSKRAHHQYTSRI
jgi:hypothetical protein